jgi:hypothetical protein
MSTTDTTKGSKLQIRRYVNAHRDALDAQLVAALPELGDWEIEWVSPLEADRFKEYRDGLFLEALGFKALDARHRDFWPRRGSTWDALAKLRQGSTNGVLLVEAKAHPGEINASASGAEGDRLETIRQSINKTIEHYGAKSTVDSWIGPRFYQAANRLAHLYFCEKESVPAWLVNIYFVDDQSNRPTTSDQWADALANFKADFGLDPTNITRCADVFLGAIND